MIEVLFGTLEAGLKLWGTEEANKYLDEVAELKKEWYYEYNKTEHDNALLDNIERELRIICEAFSSKARIQNSGD